METKRVVVTGAAGFIGSHVVEALVKAGHQVLGVDNLITGNVRNLGALPHVSFELLKHDLSQPLHLDRAVDEIYHLASPASPRDYLEFPIQTLKVGALGTHHMLGLAKAKDAAFLLASTSEVYGDPTVSPQPETYWGNVNPIGPRGVYDEAKRYAEALTMAYHQVHGLRTRIARIFNTYGPRMRPNDGRAIPNFISQALAGKPLTVHGDGTQTRSFCYVDDLVGGLVTLMERGDSMPYNLGTEDEVTVLELAQKIQKMTATDSRIAFEALPQDDPKQRRPDTTRARNELGWAPKTGLDDGLRRTIDYFRSLGPPEPAPAPSTARRAS